MHKVPYFNISGFSSEAGTLLGIHKKICITHSKTSGNIATKIFSLTDRDNLNFSIALVCLVLPRHEKWLVLRYRVCCIIHSECLWGSNSFLLDGCDKSSNE